MAVQLEGLDDACGAEDPSRVCRKVFEWTDNETLAGLAEWFIERPLRIVAIIVLAWLVNRIARRSITALSDGIRDAPSHPRLKALRLEGPGADAIDHAEAARAPARAEAIEAILKNLVTVVVWIIAVMLVLGEFRINLAPLIAGAGIVGIAIGFGAQSIVADFLAGTFMLLEDQYGIGDVIEVDTVTGEVENISLRTTKIRDFKGTVWHIPNSEIKKVGNHSQIWSNAVLDVEVGLDADLKQCMQLMNDVADGLFAESHAEGHAGDVIEDPQVLGVQNVGENTVTLRLVAKTDPLARWRVQRELRLRLIDAFSEAGITLPRPTYQVTVSGDAVSLGAPPAS